MERKQNVMKQYEDAYKCFKFIGPTPIDYDYKESSILGNEKCVTEELCKFILDEMITKKYSKIGIIFNLDTQYIIMYVACQASKEATVVKKQPSLQ